MRLRLAVAASLTCALTMVAVYGTANANVTHPPRHNYGLTINAEPNPIIADEGVLIYGQLKGQGANGQTIRLYHHIAGRPGYSLVSTTQTFFDGYYEFTRAEGIVATNRDWFVRGPSGSHSRTIHEHVAALVTLSASTANATTGQAIMFSGHVTPNHAFQRVLLQEQVGQSNDWHTLRTALLGPGSNYAVPYRFKTPGERDLRVALPADARNIQSESDPVSITIQQKQVAGFTIYSSAPIQSYGQLVTISGRLSGVSSPTTVQLWARPATGGPFTFVNQMSTSNGNYAFTVLPSVNTVYQARTASPPFKHSAELWQGVRDVLSLSASSNSSTVGGLVTFSGTVAPDKAGQAVYLQRLGPDGDWHSVEESYVSNYSTFQFAWRFGKAGTYQFRARIFSDGRNVGSASQPVTVSVAGNAPVNSLPPAS